MSGIPELRSIQSRYLQLITLLFILPLVHGAFLSSSYFGAFRSDSVIHRLSSLGELNAYIDEHDGIISSGPRTFCTSHTKKDDDIHTTIKTRIPPKQLPNGGRVTLVGSGPVRDLVTCR